MAGPATPASTMMRLVLCMLVVGLAVPCLAADDEEEFDAVHHLSLIHISEPTRPY